MDSHSFVNGIIIGLSIGLVVGAFIGYAIAKRSKSPDSSITAIGLLSVIATIGFVVLSYAFDREPNWIIAVAILVTGYGAKGGEIIERILEKRK